MISYQPASFLVSACILWYVQATVCSRNTISLLVFLFVVCRKPNILCDVPRPKIWIIREQPAVGDREHLFQDQRFGSSKNSWLLEIKNIRRCSLSQSQCGPFENVPCSDRVAQIPKVGYRFGSSRPITKIRVGSDKRTVLSFKDRGCINVGDWLSVQNIQNGWEHPRTIALRDQYKWLGIPKIKKCNPKLEREPRTAPHLEVIFSLNRYARIRPQGSIMERKLEGFSSRNLHETPISLCWNRLSPRWIPHQIPSHHAHPITETSYRKQ